MITIKNISAFIDDIVVTSTYIQMDIFGLYHIQKLEAVSLDFARDFGYNLQV